MKPVLGMAVDYYKLRGDNSYNNQAPMPGIVASIGIDDRVTLCVWNQGGYPMSMENVLFVEKYDSHLCDYCVPSKMLFGPLDATVAELQKRVGYLEEFQRAYAKLEFDRREASEFRPAVVSSQAVVVGDETPLE